LLVLLSIYFLGHLAATCLFDETPRCYTRGLSLVKINRNSRSINVFIRGLGTRSTVITLPLNATIAEVLEVLRRRRLIPSDTSRVEHRLYCDDRRIAPLNLAASLFELGLQDMSHLSLRFSVNGGSQPPGEPLTTQQSGPSHIPLPARTSLSLPGRTRASRSRLSASISTSRELFFRYRIRGRC